MNACPACGGPITEDAERTTRRLIDTLDDARRQRLSDAYQGHPPAALCAGCFLPTAATLNGVRE